MLQKIAMVNRLVKIHQSNTFIEFKVGDWLWEEGSSRANPRLITKLWINKANDRQQYAVDFENSIDQLGYVTVDSRYADSREITMARQTYPHLVIKENEIKTMKKEFARYKSRVQVGGFPAGTEFCVQTLISNSIGGHNSSEFYAPKGYWNPLFLHSYMEETEYFELLPEETEYDKAKKKLEVVNNLVDSFNDLL